MRFLRRHLKNKIESVRPGPDARRSESWRLGL